jgi:hypothetical protein
MFTSFATNIPEQQQTTLMHTICGHATIKQHSNLLKPTAGGMHMHDTPEV